MNKQQIEQDYVPYGPEWEKELMQFNKPALINLLRKAYEWKNQAVAVMPDLQKIGQLLNIPLGQNVSNQIIPKIEELQARLVAQDAGKESEGEALSGEGEKMAESYWWNLIIDENPSMAALDYEGIKKAIEQRKELHTLRQQLEAGKAPESDWVKYFKPPFRIAPESPYITDDSGMIVIEIKGLRNLIFHMLSHDEAQKIQETLMINLVDYLNKLKP